MAEGEALVASLLFCPIPSHFGIDYFSPMGYAYDQPMVSNLLYEIIRRHLSEKTEKWLTDQVAQWQQNGSLQQFNLAFAAAPRFLGRGEVYIDLPDADELSVFSVDNTSPVKIVETKVSDGSIPGIPVGKVYTLEHWSSGIGQYPFNIYNLTIDRLFRAWWLLQLPITDREEYVRITENLFISAEMNEQVALYSALPLLAFPEEWRERTAEGIRSNIGIVLEAIMLDNPYPAMYLSEPAWNQLVLKAFFTDKAINSIIGLDGRANAALAHTLSDLAHERWAAGRQVNPLTWRLVAPFINETNFADIERIWYSEQQAEREAAFLACFNSSYPPARALLEKRPEWVTDITTNQLTWETVAARING